MIIFPAGSFPSVQPVAEVVVLLFELLDDPHLFEIHLGEPFVWDLDLVPLEEILDKNELFSLLHCR